MFLVSWKSNFLIWGKSFFSLLLSMNAASASHEVVNAVKVVHFCFSLTMVFVQCTISLMPLDRVECQFTRKVWLVFTEARKTTWDRKNSKKHLCCVLSLRHLLCLVIVFGIFNAFNLGKNPAFNAPSAFRCTKCIGIAHYTDIKCACMLVGKQHLQF